MKSLPPLPHHSQPTLTLPLIIILLTLFSAFPVLPCPVVELNGTSCLTIKAPAHPRGSLQFFPLISALVLISQKDPGSLQTITLTEV